MKNKFDRKVFIVDDEELITKALKRHVEKLGYHDVTTFSDGYQCLNQITDKPDVIFLDYQMNEIDGYQVLRKIKRFDPNIYVVMLSSQQDLEAAVETLKFGAFDYIKKGGDDLKKVENALERIYQVEERLLVPRKSLFSKLFAL